MNTITESAGNIINLRTTNPLHYTGIKEEQAADESQGSGSFADELMKAVGKVNKALTDSDELNRKMIYEPESVDIHTVLIAAQKAEIALNFTKSIRDEAIRTYRELMNLR